MVVKPECQRILIIVGIVALTIVVYWLVLLSVFGSRNMTQHDFLNQRVMDNPFTGSPLSWWPFTHLVMYIILGWMFPNCLALLFSIGVAWELIEMGFAQIFSQPYHYIRTAQGVEYPNWWAGSTLDIGMNTIGLIIGWWLSKKIGVLKVKYLNTQDNNSKLIFIQK